MGKFNGFVSSDTNDNVISFFVGTGNSGDKYDKERNDAKLRRRHIVAEFFVNEHMSAEMAKQLALMTAERLNEAHELNMSYIRNQFMQKRHP